MSGFLQLTLVTRKLHSLIIFLGGSNFWRVLPATYKASAIEGVMESEDAVVEALAGAGPESGQQTAKRAAKLLADSEEGFIVPTAKQRKAIIVAFAQANYIIYGKAFDVVKVHGEKIDLDNPVEVEKHFKRITIYEIKSTNKPSVGSDFGRYFFSLTTAELLVAQSLGPQYRFVFVNTRTKTWLELALREVFARSRNIYPTWSIQF